MTLSFAIAGPPRTKKTSNRVVRITPKGGGRSFTKILPSAAFEEWFDVAMSQAPMIRRKLLDQGFDLPLRGPVAVRATFYRDRFAGDATGFYQALADWLQEPVIDPDTGRTRRNGAGIIGDDSQVMHWDGSRLAKDANCPRIEVAIEVLGEHQGDLLTFAEVAC